MILDRVSFYMLKCRLNMEEMHVDGEQLVHGTVYTFKLRVSDGHRWCSWTEYSPAMQALVASSDLLIRTYTYTYIYISCL